jgi:hypothetical protein
MQIRSASKYHLKDLHAEIGLFDRKIEHCQKYEKFDSEFERTAALKKLATNRGKLVKAAAAMVSQGIEFDPTRLPRSLKTSEVSEQKPSA